MISLAMLSGLAALGILIALYWLMVFQFNYWTRRGIPQLKPSIPFGNAGEFFRQRLCFGQLYEKLYERTKQLPFVGTYLSFQPILLVNDPALIRTILARDFGFFHDRGLYVDETKDPLSANLVAIAGEKWRYHRSGLSPAFTASRMRGMFPILVKIGRTVQEYVERCAASEQVVEVRELMSRYTTDVIASVGFGLEIDSINNGDSMFRQVGKIMFGHSLKSTLRLACVFFSPKLVRWFGIKQCDQVVEDVMLSVVRETVEYREEHNVFRQDLMQLLLQLRNSGTVSFDGNWDVGVSKSDKTLSIQQVAAHAFAFLSAGYETSSSTTSTCLFELARNKDIQRKLQQEIDGALSPDNGMLTYENIATMKYLECCIDETLRKYPPVPFLIRECTKDYVIPNTNITIRPGTGVVVPVIGIHHDPNYFAEPEKFIPERFSDEQRSADMPYLPFGHGPRNCIGLRLGILETKVALVILLSKYDIRLENERQMFEELRYDPKAIVMLPVNGINLIFSKRGT